MAVAINIMVFRIATSCISADDLQRYTEIYFYGIQPGALTMNELIPDSPIYFIYPDLPFAVCETSYGKRG
jgi:hypothetical protein